MEAIRFFDLVGMYRVVIARLYITYYITKARLSSVENIKFYLCPNNRILLIDFDDNRVKSDGRVDMKLLLEIFDFITCKKYVNLKGFKLQKADYKSNDGSESGLFDLVTIPLIIK